LSDPKKFKITLPSGLIVEVPEGQNLRISLKNHFDEIYPSPMKLIHCRGLGSCGTCSMYIDGKTTPPTLMEKLRLNFPPHRKGASGSLRLLCQTQPLSDLVFKKGKGRWGQD
jgi:ferredoxin